MEWITEVGRRRAHSFVAGDHAAIVDVVFDSSGRAMFSFDDSVSSLLVWFLIFGIGEVRGMSSNR